MGEGKMQSIYETELQEKDELENDCIAFTGGGTGGHIYPGLAVIEELRRLGFKGRIAWIGSEKELDRSIVTGQGIEYHAIPSGKFRRELSLRNISDLGRVASAYFRARALLKDIGPSILFSKGGYVSVPPCWAASSLGIPVITHESDASPGLATRLNSKKASLILTSWEVTAQYFPESLRTKIIRAGNPVRPDILNGDRQRGLSMLEFVAEKPVLFVLGGSQGAQEVNDIVLSSLNLLVPLVQIVHQTGRANFDEVKARVPDDPAVRRAYRPFPYIGSEIADIYAASTMIAGRAGAGTIWEAASLGKPMILIPLSGSGTRGDQVENAALAERSGIATVLLKPNISSNLFVDAVKKYLNIKNYAMAEEACRNLVHIVKTPHIPEITYGPSQNPILSAEYIAQLLLTKMAEWAKESA